MKLSVVIPTYNRKESLITCLQALFKQTCLKSDFEIIVVDDGSTDGTEGVLDEMVKQTPVHLRFFRQENRGPAAARNTGIRNAGGETVLFVGDDTIADPDLLKEHIEWHRNHPEQTRALLGYTTWSPDMKITPFLEFLETGPQFNYPGIADPHNVFYGHFYTTNISLKKNFLDSYGYFDEDFNRAMLEDTELGYRLSRHGLKIHYSRNAVVYHYHPTDLRRFVERQFNVGRYSVLFLTKHPELIDLFFPQLTNPLLILNKEQTDELIEYLDSVENYMIANDTSDTGTGKIRESLYFLYRMLFLASQNKGLLDELSSQRLVKNKDVNLFAGVQESVAGIKGLPFAPPPALHFIIHEYYNQKEARERELLNSWSWKITAPLRWVQDFLTKRSDI